MVSIIHGFKSVIKTSQLSGSNFFSVPCSPSLNCFALLGFLWILITLNIHFTHFCFVRDWFQILSGLPRKSDAPEGRNFLTHLIHLHLYTLPNMLCPILGTATNMGWQQWQQLLTVHYRGSRRGFAATENSVHVLPRPVLLY